MFEGNAISTVYSGYYFYVAALQKYGLAVFSLDDFNVFRAKQISLGDDFDFVDFEDVWGLLASDKIGVSSFYYEEPDGIKGEFKKTVITSDEIEELIDYTKDTKYEDRKSDVSTKEKTIRKIQNSPDGCIIGELASGSSSKGTNSAVRIYFHKRHLERKDRVPSLKSTTLFTAHPRRHSGAKYAYKQSKNIDETGAYVGYVNITEEDYASMVSAPLKLIYNHNQGVWESAGAFLGMVLEDIDGAELVAPNVDPDTLSSKSPNDFYGDNAEENMSNHTTGLVMPLATQDNNPHAFGPNFIKTGVDGEGKNEYRIEKIRGVNRTSSNFTKGEIVLVQPVDGENILVKFAGDAVIVERPPKWEGNWEFAKFIASSDDYFRLTNGDRIKEDEIPDLIWRKIYSNGDNRLLSLGYFQDSIFYQTSQNFPGGHLSGTKDAWGGVDKRVNTTIGAGNSLDVALDSITSSQIPIFWGPVFTQGYRQSKVVLLNGEERRTEQIPAEIATMGTRENGGSPIFDYNAVLLAINGSSYTDLYNSRNTLLTRALKNVTHENGYALKPSNENQIQFSFLSAELCGHLDKNCQATLITKNLFNATKRCRDFYNGIANFSGLPAGTNLFGNYPFGNIAMTNQQAWEHLYSEAPSESYSGPKYDCYITKADDWNRPQGSYEMFGGSQNPGFSGANAVGLTAARRKLYKSGSFDLSAETTQTFGTQGVFFGGGGGGGINVTILGGLFAWSTDTRGKTIQGTTVVWGSASDSIYSFGTGALHVDVWDGWPREDTAWLPQYACPVHFNPNKAIPSSKIVKVNSWNSSKSEYEEVDIYVDPLELDIDYRVPTYGTKDPEGRVIYNTEPDGTEVEENTKIYSNTAIRPEIYWVTNYSRRGKLVTGYGYFWDKMVIGVDKSSITIKSPGKTYSVNDVILCKNNIVIKVTSVNGEGGITGATVARSSDTNNSDLSKPRTLKHPINGDSDWDEIGEGLLPSSFPLTIRVPSQGAQAEITFANGLCAKIPQCDHPPKRRSQMTRISLPSTNGQRRVYGAKTSNISVESNTGNQLENDVTKAYSFKYPGSYEVFTYCHNDIGIAIHAEPDLTTGIQMHNYITVTFS